MNLRHIKNIFKAEGYGIWFLFFFTVYLILILKIFTIKNLPDSHTFGVYSILVSGYILSRFLLAYFHKSLPCDETYAPTVTFVVPAKNEGENIRETLRRFAQVSYPKNKIEVIAVNDGSTDNTYHEMLAAKSEIGQVVKIEIVNWKINRGKRHGMAEGVKRSKSEIIIFVDSDSFVEKDCVRHLVKYFANPEVGAVSGHTDVWNWDTNWLTRTQNVRYYLAFRIYKAAESLFGAVTCCPGCCSAYRREYLTAVIDKWLNQTFLGVRCTYGDDRGLTNFIMRKYKAVYSAEALAFTVVPEAVSQYLKQQLRWKKSWIRETFIAATFMWRKNIIAALSFYAYMFLVFASPLSFARALLWYPLTTYQIPLTYLAGLFLVLFLHSAYYRTQTANKSWLFIVLAFWLHNAMLIWQLPWAVVTIRDPRWGTR